MAGAFFSPQALGTAEEAYARLMRSALGESGWEPLFWLVFEHSSNPVVLVDQARRIVHLNDAAVGLWRGSREQLVGASIVDSIEPSERPRAQAEWQEFLGTGAYAGSRELLRADGSQVRVEFAARSASVGGRRLAVYVLVMREDATGAGVGGVQLPLSDRERQVVTLIALGKETGEIASELHISPETVRSHVRNAMSKLGAHTRAQLVAIVICAEHALDPPCVHKHAKQN